MTIARKVTTQEYEQGFVMCDCGKFAYIMKSSVVSKLRNGYSGELCPECNRWMCSVEELRKAGLINEEVILRK